MRHDSSGTLAGWENIECDVDDGAGRASAALRQGLKRALDLAVGSALLFVLAPVILAVALAIRLESAGPAFYRCRRVGRAGREFDMIKFRKMHDGATGPALASWEDDRFTRLGAFLARTKLDELPQLWNVLRGQMSLVGPRPEDGGFVELFREPYESILAVRPGITGLSQLAFARESEVLDPDDRIAHYVRAILPQKIGMDRFYVARRSLGMDLTILWWTMRAIAVRRQVAVHRETGRLTRRAPRSIPAHRNSSVVLEQEAS